MDRTRLGFVLLVAAPVAWLAGVLVTDASTAFDVYLLPLVVILAGVALAAWAVPNDRRILAAVGMALAAVGMGLFYGFDFFSGLANRAGGIVLLGLAIGAVAVLADAPRGLAAGLIVVASGGLLWVYVDGTAWEWQPGNLLLVAGATLSAVAEWRRG